MRLLYTDSMRLLYNDSAQPRAQPSAQPWAKPSAQPSAQPRAQPTRQPTRASQRAVGTSLGLAWAIHRMFGCGAEKTHGGCFFGFWATSVKTQAACRNPSIPGTASYIS